VLSASFRGLRSECFKITFDVVKQRDRGELKASTQDFSASLQEEQPSVCYSTIITGIIHLNYCFPSDYSVLPDSSSLENVGIVTKICWSSDSY